MGNPELDAMLGGGLPAGYSLLVAGPSGSGKSVLASAFLEEGARNGETGVIASFEQRPNRQRTPALAALIAAGKIALVDNRAPDLSIDEIARLLIHEIERLKATRVVIDSLSGFELALAPTFRKDFRESLSRLVMALAATGVTVLMTSELEDRYTDLRFSPYGTAFMTDAIIVQRYIEVDSRLLRVMAVVKVRASTHSDELRQFSIGDNGIHIGGTLPNQEGLLGGRPTRKAVADLPPADGALPAFQQHQARPVDVTRPGGRDPGELAQAERDLAILTARNEQARAELDALQIALVDATQRLSRCNSGELVAVNAALVSATLEAQAATADCHEELEDASRLGGIDALTGLPNRELFLDRFAHALALAARHGHRMAVLFLDIDHFKQVNDMLGHKAGDQVLKQVADCLSACVREADTVYRHGGDEFVILLSEISQAKDATTIADKVMASLDVPCLLDGEPLHLTASIGISVYPDERQRRLHPDRQGRCGHVRRQARRPWPADVRRHPGDGETRRGVVLAGGAIATDAVAGSAARRTRRAQHRAARGQRTTGARRDQCPDALRRRRAGAPPPEGIHGRGRA